MSALPNFNPAPGSRRSPSQLQTSDQRISLLEGKSSRPNKGAQVIPLNQPKKSTNLWESGFILGMNLLLMGTAVVTLAHLVPHQFSQQAKLQELRQEKSQVAQNLQTLKQDYIRGQSPAEAKRIAEDQGNLMQPNRMQVFWLKSEKSSVQ